jgi:hypothetical protein
MFDCEHTTHSSFMSACLQDEEVSNIKRVLEVLLRGRSGPVTPRPKFTTVSIQQDENKRELLYTLMGACG